MTVDRNESIKIPKWLVMYVMPGLVSLVVSYGVFKGNEARTDTILIQHSEAIKNIQDTKVDRNEQNLILNSLQRIEIKLDRHIEGSKH